MQSEIKKELLGNHPETGEDLDIIVSKKTQIICNLCGIPSCRHIKSLPQEDFHYLVGKAFPSWKLKFRKWFDRNSTPLFFLDFSIVAGTITYLVLWYLK